MKATDVEIERRCGMVTGASCGHVTLSWIPGDGRNGTRSWVLATHDGDSIRRIRLSRNEDGDFRDFLYAMSLKRLKRKCEKYAKRERKAIAYVATLKEES